MAGFAGGVGQFALFTAWRNYCYWGQFWRDTDFTGPYSSVEFFQHDHAAPLPALGAERNGVVTCSPESNGELPRGHPAGFRDRLLHERVGQVQRIGTVQMRRVADTYRQSVSQ